MSVSRADEKDLAFERNKICKVVHYSLCLHMFFLLIIPWRLRTMGQEISQRVTPLQFANKEEPQSDCALPMVMQSVLAELGQTKFSRLLVHLFLLAVHCYPREACLLYVFIQHHCLATDHFRNDQLLHVKWRRQWQPTLVFLPGKSHGRRSLIDGKQCTVILQAWPAPDPLCISLSQPQLTEEMDSLPVTSVEGYYVST